jgi:hypothetical protein
LSSRLTFLNALCATMNRLQAEFQRLYLPLVPDTAGPAASTHPAGRCSRALVLELARPADWSLLSAVWRGVQADLELPAPAIAVSGIEGLQLWFSLCEPVSLTQAQDFLEALRRRYLPEVAPQRVRLMPVVAHSAVWDAASDPTSGPTAPAPQVPALQASTGNWSAFVAADLAPLFSDTPWLDVPPGDEGQAHLLSGIASIKPTAWAAALAQLAAADPPAQALQSAAAAASPEPAQQRAYAAELDPKGFLLAVMNDDSVSLALRIEAAKALLPFSATTTRP